MPLLTGRAFSTLYHPWLHGSWCFVLSVKGDDFKIFEVMFDGALNMGAATRAIATEAGWRLQRLLKARRYFTIPEMVHLYKAQILSYVESSTPGVYHAAVSVLSSVDRIQRKFLREVGLSDVQALS